MKALKRVCRCYECKELKRTNKMYKVYYSGDEILTEMMPPIQVENKLVRLCARCYEAAGYVTNRGKKIQLELPQAKKEPFQKTF